MSEITITNNSETKTEIIVVRDQSSKDCILYGKSDTLWELGTLSKNRWAINAVHVYSR